MAQDNQQLERFKGTNGYYEFSPERGTDLLTVDPELLRGIGRLARAAQNVRWMQFTDEQAIKQLYMGFMADRLEHAKANGQDPRELGIPSGPTEASRTVDALIGRGAAFVYITVLGTLEQPADAEGFRDQVEELMGSELGFDHTIM